MKSLITGCNFLLKNVPNECFQFKIDSNDEPEFQFKNLNPGEDIFPYLLVNIGSGVSILKVRLLTRSKFKSCEVNETGMKRSFTSSQTDFICRLQALI